jgi:cytochrome c-type biogenesis protein CcmH/NrfG
VGLTGQARRSPPDAGDPVQEINMTTTRIGRLAGMGLLALALAVSGPALAIDTGGGSTDTTTAAPAAAPSLATARADIAASNWTKAISDLKAFLKGNSKSADGWNLLGFSYRNHGDLKLADTAYDRALKLDPKHTGALSYQGILYIKLGKTDEAKANLAKIETICGNTTCAEYVALSKALG